MTDSDLLWRAARRLAADRFFLASALLAFAASEGLDEDGLARHLGCAADELPALLLCRRPGGEGQMFRASVQRIAERFGADPARLARAIRLADAIEGLGKTAGESKARLLAAARDREEREDT